ncbi:MAG: SprB repeat-containing protein [Chitinophagaceae bacterium]|nr:SprB repeat-containing protein [Chitinophagaceae bacterium]
MKRYIRLLLLLLLCSSAMQAQTGRGKLTAAEYFFDTDPGQGSGIALNLQGGINDALRTALQTTTINLSPGLHTLNVRVKDSLSQWSPVFKTTLNVETQMYGRSINVAFARMYWDANVAGATNLIILNGNVTDAVNTFINASPISSFGTAGMHKINLQVMDATGNYSLPFTTTISVENQLTLNRLISAALGRAYWDNNTGSSVGLIILNGNAGSAVNEFLTATPISSFGTPGIHKLNVQLLDPNGGGNYSPAFSTAITFENAIDTVRPLRVDAGRVWFDNNVPGSPNMIAFDGNFNQAIESAIHTLNAPSLGLHTISVQLRDSLTSNWGPVFKTTLIVETPMSYRNINVATGQLYWDNDTNNLTQTLLAFDGNYDNAIEDAFKSNVPVPNTVGLHTLCVRFKEVANNWSAPFRMSVKVDDSLFARDIKVTQGEVRIDNTPAIMIVALSGNFNNALEQAQTTLLSTGVLPGMHKIMTRIKGTGGNWGPFFTTAVLVSPCATTPMPTVTASSPITFCQGDSTILTASNGFSSYQWIRNNTVVGNGQTIVAKDSGEYVVIVTDVTDCPGVSSAVLVDVHHPVVTIAPNATLCQGTTDSLIATPGFSSYAWSAGSTTNKQYVTSAGTYSVTVTDNIGCSASTSTTIAQLSQPTIPVITASGPTSFCYGSNVVLTSSATSNIVWNTGQTTPSLTIDTSGYYSVTVTGANGCQSTSAGVYTTRFPVPQVSVSASGPLTFCDGNSVTLSASPSLSYLWSNGSTASAINVGVGGNYSVAVIDSNGCPVSSNSLSVTVNPNPPVPVVSASGPLSFCNGNSVTLTSSAASNNHWNNGPTTPSQVVYLSGVFRDSVTNAFGCYSVSAPVTVDVHPVASITASGPTTMCFGESVTLTAHPSTGVNYLWSNGSTSSTVTLSSSQLASVIVTEPGPACKDTAYANIVVHPLPTGTIAAQGPTTVCYGNGVVLNATGSANTKYKWYFNGSPITYYSYSIYCSCLVPYNIYGNSYTATTSGNYSAQIIDTLTGCTSMTNSINATVILPPKPVITANGGTTLCIGANTVLSSTPASAYLWSTGETTQTIIADSQGYYSVTITDVNGCTRTSDTTLVTFYPVASITSSGPTTFCANESVNLTAHPAGTYLWTNGNTSASINNINTNGTYGVTVTDANGCTSTAPPVNIVVNPLPTGSISAAGPTDVCSGNSVTLNTASVPNTIYKWYVNGSPISYSYYSGQCSCSITVYTYGYSYGATTSGVYSAEIIDTLTGCSSMTNSIPVIIYPLPTAAITQTATIPCYGGNQAALTAVASGSTAPYTYLWNTNATTASITNLPAATYTVLVTDAHACSFDTTYTIQQPSLVSAYISSPTNTRGYQISCYGGNNGSATAIPSGGTGPYTYLWSTGATTQSISGLTAGTYSVTVTDANNCLPATATFTLTQPAPISLTLSPYVFYGGTNISCYGDSNGSITALPTGGTANFTFQWSDGQNLQTADTLPAGFHSVIVTDSVGCTAMAGTFLTQPSALTHSSFVSGNMGYNIPCHGDSTASILTAVIGGTSPYHFAWSDTALSLQNRFAMPAGTYQLTITDTLGCINTDTFTLVEPDSIMISMTGSLLNCNGDANGTATAIASGGVGPYSYLWSNGTPSPNANGLSAGYYLVTVTDAFGCTMVDQVQVEEPTAVTAYAFGTYIGCGSQIGLLSVTGSGGNGPYTFAWSNGSTAAFQTNQPLGIYGVMITDTHGCQDSADAIILSPPAINATVTNYSTTCDSITTVPAGAVSVSVSGGVPPYMYLWSNGATTPSINNLITGYYTVIVTDANGCTANPVAHAFNNDPAVIFGEDTICLGTQANLSTIPGSNFSWSNGMSVVGTTQQVTVPPGSYTLSMINLNGCPQSAAVTVVDQQCYADLDLKMYIEGYYEGSGLMRPVLMNQGVGSDPLVTDTIMVELHEQYPPYNLIASTKGILHTNGAAFCTFSAVNDTCFIVLKHRNGVETWSSVPVYLSPVPAVYDFSNAASKAYGNNQVQMAPGIWAIYSGDIDQSGGIDGDDFNILDPDIQFGNGGYLSTDLDGSGGVDGDDFNIFDPNSQNGVGAFMP